MWTQITSAPSNCIELRKLSPLCWKRGGDFALLPKFSIERDSRASKVCKLKLSESFSNVFLKCSSYSMRSCEVGEAGSSASELSFDELGVVAKQCESKMSTSSEVGDKTLKEKNNVYFCNTLY